jgi:hypothetical protein
MCTLICIMGSTHVNIDTAHFHPLSDVLTTISSHMASLRDYDTATLQNLGYVSVLLVSCLTILLGLLDQTILSEIRYLLCNTQSRFPGRHPSRISS